MGLVILVALMVYGMAIFVYQNRPSIVESQGKIALLGIVILVVTLVREDSSPHSLAAGHITSTLRRGLDCSSRS